MERKYWKWCKSYVPELSKVKEKYSRLKEKDVAIEGRSEFDEEFLYFWIGRECYSKLSLNEDGKVYLVFSELTIPSLLLYGWIDGKIYKELLIDVSELRKHSELDKFREDEVTYAIPVEVIEKLGAVIE